MCECCRDTAVISAVDHPRMTSISQRIESILQKEVFLVVLDNDWTPVFDYGTNSRVVNEFRAALPQMRTVISGCEDAIRQLNTGWRVEELLSFKLNCHSSRIFVFILTESYRLVIINRFDGALDEAPSVDNEIRSCSGEVKDAIYALAPAHNA